MIYVRNKKTGAISQLVAKPWLGKGSNYELVDGFNAEPVLPPRASAIPVGNKDLTAGVSDGENDR